MREKPKISVSVDNSCVECVIGAVPMSSVVCGDLSSG